MGDASNYVQYANNLVDHGTFSKSHDTSDPMPDSFWAPGYPAFIAAAIWAEKITGIKAYTLIMYSQSVIGALVCVLSLLCARLFLGKMWSILAATLVAFSPHLISMGGYLLTETFFSFLLLASIYSLSIAFTQKKWWIFIISGVLFGLTYLVNPVVFFAPILLISATACIVAAGKDRFPVNLKLKLLSCLAFFFIIVGIWSIRNMISVPPGQSSSSKRLLINLVIGTHSNFFDIWRNNPRDPQNPATKDLKNLNESYIAFTDLLLKRIYQDPSHYAKWYLIEKPLLLWSWNILVGQGDIYVYPVKYSLYDRSGIAFITYIVMKSIHYWLFGLALTGILFLFKGINSQHHTPLFLYITLIYISTVYVVTQSEPRYSIPIRPEMYICAVFSISKISKYLHSIITNKNNTSRRKIEAVS